MIVLDIELSICFWQTICIARCSSGIEPLFQPIYERRFNEHRDTHDQVSKNKSMEVVVHPLLKKFVEKGRNTKNFQGAHDITPEEHLAMQIVCQKHIDNSISKTINLPEDYPVDKLSTIIKKCIRDLKGVTVYRDNSKGGSPLIPLPLSEAKEHLKQMSEKAAVNDCPSG